MRLDAYRDNTLQCAFGSPQPTGERAVVTVYREILRSAGIPTFPEIRKRLPNWDVHLLIKTCRIAARKGLISLETPDPSGGWIDITTERGRARIRRRTEILRRIKVARGEEPAAVVLPWELGPDYTRRRRRA
jgi:hypothetical protein